MRNKPLLEITEAEIQSKIFEFFQVVLFVIVEDRIVSANKYAFELLKSKGFNLSPSAKIEELFDKTDFDKALQILKEDGENLKRVKLKILYEGNGDVTKHFFGFPASYGGKEAVVLIGEDFSAKVEWFFTLFKDVAKIWAILKLLPHPIFLLDENGNVREYVAGNTQLSEMLPWNLSGRNLFDVMPSEITGNLRKNLNLAFQTGTPQGVECEFSWHNQVFSIYSLIIPVENDEAILVLFDRTRTIGLERDVNLLSNLYRTVISITLDFAKADPSELSAKINSALELIGKATDVDRVYVFDYDFDKGIMRNTYEWCAPGIEPQIENLQELPNSSIPEWVQSHLAKKNIIIHNVSELPEGDNLREILEAQDIKSLITIPIFLHNELIGFVGYGSVKRHRVFEEKEIQILEVFAELLGAIAFRTRIEERLSRESKELQESQAATLNVIEDLQDEIERRKKIEKSLEISERNYRDIFTSVSEAIFILDIKTGRILDANESAVKMYKYETKEEMLAVESSLLRAGIEPYTEENFRKLITSALQEGVQVSEWLAKKKDGKLFWVELTVKKIFLVDKDVILVVERDITDRKEVELLLKLQYNIANAMVTAKSLSEFLHTVRVELSSVMDTSNFFIAKYNSAKDTLQQMIWVDEKDEFNEWKAEDSLSGIVVKLNQPLLLYKDDIKRMEQSHQLLGTAPECWLGVPIVVNKEVFGVIVVQSYTDRDAYDRNSQEILQTVANQIGAYLEKMMAEQSLIEAKEKAEESDRLKTAFLQNISHEIRTPLNGIIGFAQLLYETEVSKEEVKEYSDIILTSANRLLDLLNNIIDISKIQAGTLEARYSSINLNEAINKVIRHFSLAAGKKNLELRTKYSLADEDAVIYSDELFIYQILSNLISNAIKFTDEGSIEVGYKLKGDKLMFSVQDTGCGIPAEQQPRIFEKFYQANTSLSRRYEGAGLGLTITKGLVETLGGEIWFESVPEEGTTFYFTIPYHLSRPSFKKPEIEVEKKSSGKKKKILVVEDEQINYLYIKTILKSENFEVIPAFTGKQAIESVKNNDFDLVLMDIKLPELSGIEATKAIKQIKPDLPIIAQSAYAFANEKEEMMKAGCDGYISKPFLKRDFLNLVKKFLV